MVIFSDFATKRDVFVTTSQRLEQEAQIVLDVIENPKVAQALRQDKLQNLVYLKENHDVISLFPFIKALADDLLAHFGADRSTLQFRAISIHVWKLFWSLAISVSFQSPLNRCGPATFLALG